MAIARVQFKVADTAATAAPTSLAITFGAATTAGNVVLVGVNTTGGVLLRVSSANGIFYNATPAAQTAGATSATQMFWGIMKGADTVITVQGLTGATNLGSTCAIAAEYSGVNITPDALPSNSVSTTANANTGFLTNTNTNALYCAAIGQRTFNSATENSTWASANVQPFNIVGQTTTNVNSGNADKALVYLDAIVSTSSSRAANVTSALGSLVSAGLLATFYEITVAAAGGGLRVAGHGGLAS